LLSVAPGPTSPCTRLYPICCLQETDQQTLKLAPFHPDRQAYTHCAHCLQGTAAPICGTCCQPT
jgi:hypothetical protein